MIKKLPILIALLMMVNYINAQVDVTATSGLTSGNYPTLADAFSKVNDGTHKGSITITLTASTTETVTSNLDSSGNTTGSSYSSITIKPQAATTVNISGAVVGSLIVLNGADNVTIDGLNVGGATLTIFNSEATASSAIKLINDASNNKILNSTIKGAGASSTLGVVHFSTGLSTGNDGNKIANCNIDAIGNAYNGIYSSGSSTTSDLQNSNDTIQTCKIYDFFNATASSPMGLCLYSGNTNWYILGNSVYQTTSRSTSLQTLIAGIVIYPSWTTDAHVVKNNLIGGTTPNATITFTFTGTGTNVVGFQGINIQTGGIGGLAEGNIVKNISCTYSSASGSFSNTGYYAYIAGFDGVTTFNNNTIDNFSVTNNGGSCAGAGIIVNGRVTTAATTVKPIFNLTNNTISNLIFNTSGVNTSQYYGIRLDVSSSASATLTTAAISNPYFVVTGNTITNLNCTNGGASGYVRAIGVLSSQGTGAAATFWPKGNISNNVITGVTMNSTYVSTTSATAVGINFLGYTGSVYTTDSTIISGNTISDIKATNTGEYSSLVAGIYVTNGLYGITKNKIFNLSNASPGATSNPFVVGINSRAVVGTGNTYIANNFISLGKSSTGTSYSTNTYYYGVLNNFSTTRIHSIYHNTIVIDGTVTSGAYKSACYHRGLETFGATGNTSPTDLKNNILINLRNGGTGEHYAISAGAGTNVINSNYNNLYAANANTVGYWNGTAQTFASFQTNSTSDANSKSVTVNFVNTSAGDLHLTGTSNGDANLIGTPLSAFVTDFDGQTRSTSNPYIGADEASISLPLQLLTFNGQIKSNKAVINWSTCYEVNSAFFNIEKSTDAVNWNTIGSIAAKGNNGKNEYNFIDGNLSNIKTYYRLKIVDQNGKYVYSQIIVLELNGKLLFVLQQNYPNPVKNITTIRYQLDKISTVVLEVYSIDGKQVARLQNGMQEAGTYNMQFDVLQHQMSSGKYIYKLSALNAATGELTTISKEMTVIK